MIDVEPKRIVRPYTVDERKLTTPADKENPAKRFARLVVTQGIDAIRYREAAETHPQMQDHFDRLIDMGDVAIVAWAHYYNEQYGVDTGVQQDSRPGIAVPYSGTEDPRPQHPVRTPNPGMADLPA